MDKNVGETSIYPKRNGMVITLLDDYGTKPTNKEVNIDFSGIHCKNLAEEAISVILDRYRHHSSSVTYLRVLLPAVAHFDEYASTRGIQSFTQYTDAVREDYQAYMEEFDNSYHEKYGSIIFGVG